MKTLYLIRHAKSSWKDTGLADHDRPLNKRGQMAAPFMGKKLAEKGIKPNLMVSSTANRAITTARLIAKEVEYPLECILEERLVYNSGVPTLAHYVSQLNDDLESVFLFGHNPVHSELLDYFTGHAEHMVTCAIACIEFDTDSWNETGRSTGNLKWLDYPKRYPEMH